MRTIHFCLGIAMSVVFVACANTTPTAQPQAPTIARSLPTPSETPALPTPTPLPPTDSSTPIASTTPISAGSASSPTEIPVALTGKFMANGKSLYIECLGTGSPTIVLDNGEGMSHFAMQGIQRRLASQTMTCVYERANVGDSDHGATRPRKGQDIARDLHALLATARVPGPYLLLGHSAGGLLVQLYARLYPEDVVGVVSMNPVPPAHPWLDQVSKVFTSQQFADEKVYYEGQNGENLDYLDISERLASAPKEPAVPFEMLISTNAQCEEPNGPCMKSYSIYEQIERAVAAAWPRGKFTQVESAHEIYSDKPEAVTAAIQRILAAR